jgi:hypothetical protein
MSETMRDKAERFVGWLLWTLRVKPGFSWTIADQPSAGYGKIDPNGFWQFPVPLSHWKHHPMFELVEQRAGAGTGETTEADRE